MAENKIPYEPVYQRSLSIHFSTVWASNQPYCAMKRVLGFAKDYDNVTISIEHSEFHGGEAIILRGDEK